LYNFSDPLAKSAIFGSMDFATSIPFSITSIDIMGLVLIKSNFYLFYRIVTLVFAINA
jgi:hypothetical protein